MTALKNLIRLIVPTLFILFAFVPPSSAETAEAPAETEGVNSDAHGSGHHPGLNLFDFSNKEAAPLIALLFNFTALVVIVYLLMRKPLSLRFKDRKDTLVKALAEAAAAQNAAEAAILEARAKMDAVDAEMETIRKGIVAAANKEAEHIAAAAKTRAERLAADAKMLAFQEITRMAEAVRKDVVDRIVAEATDIIREKITDGDRDNLSANYLSALGKEAQGAADGK